jgi:hypothetical protein
MPLDEIVEPLEAVGEDMEAGRRGAERAGDDEHVAGARA